MKPPQLPKSLAGRIICVALIVVATMLLGSVLLVTVACNGETGFSCGG